MKKLALTFICLCGSLFAQEQERSIQPFTDFTLGVATNLGYTNPLFGVGSGVDLDFAHFFANTTFTFRKAQKIETGDGHSYNLDASFYGGQEHWLAGAGLNYGKEITSQWSKNSGTPYFGMLYRTGGFKLFTNYYLPFADKDNGEQGPNVIIQIPGGKHFRLTLKNSILFYHDTRVPGVDYGNVPAQNHVGVESGGQIEYLF